MMSHWQKFIYTCFNPLVFGNALTFGAMTVAAGIIGCFNMTAVVTYICMETVFCGAAMLNSVHDIELIGRELIVLAIFLSVKIKNISDFVFWLILR